MSYKNCFQLSVKTAALAAVAALISNQARATDSDVLLINVGGQVKIGAANDIGTADENFNIATSVFQGVMVPDFPPFNPVDYGRDEPGFFALSDGSSSLPSGASVLPGNAQVTIHFPSFTVGSHTDSMFYWNGAGAVDFQPISTAEPGVGLSLIPSSPLATTHVDGSLHQHSAWELGLGPDGAPVPADGIYLLSPTASVAGLTDSKPFYMLFLVDATITSEDDADALKDGLDSGDTMFNGQDYTFFNDARIYVQNNLAVPEPGVFSMVTIAGVGLIILGGTRSWTRKEER